MPNGITHARQTLGPPSPHLDVPFLDHLPFHTNQPQLSLPHFSSAAKDKNPMIFFLLQSVWSARKQNRCIQSHDFLSLTPV